MPYETDADRERFRRNIDKVKGTEVTLRRFLGSKRPRTAKIADYVPPFVWELDKPLGGTQFHKSEDVVTMDGKSLWELPGLE
jgi:hypothetical protein